MVGPGRFGVAALGIALFFAPARGSATITAPALAVTGVQSTSGERGTVIRVEGEFPFGDIVQTAYGLQIFLRETDEGRSFLCFALDRGVFRGESDAVAGGLDAETVWEMMEAAEPSTSGRVLHIGPSAIELWIAPDFDFERAEVGFFVLYHEEPIISNFVPFWLEGDLP